MTGVPNVLVLSSYPSNRHNQKETLLRGQSVSHDNAFPTDKYFSVDIMRSVRACGDAVEKCMRTVDCPAATKSNRRGHQ